MQLLLGSLGKYATTTLACVASGSARVRRENWNESKKRNEGGGGAGNACYAGYHNSTGRQKHKTKQPKKTMIGFGE